MGCSGSGAASRLHWARICEKQWAVGHSFGLQGSDLFLKETDAYTVLILWEQEQNAVGAFKAELLSWSGGGGIGDKTSLR